jgi:hypothetical protein
VRSLILEGHHLTVREIADEVGISTGSARSIVTGFAHVQSGGEICAQAAFAGATTSRSHGRCWSAPNGDPEFLKTMIIGVWI